MSKTSQNTIPLIRIDCPPDVFDTEGAYIMRRRRVSVARLDALDDMARRRNKSEAEQAEMYQMMVAIIPQWHGVMDPDTGEALPDPEDDPTVFRRLDALEQLPWMSKAMRTAAGNLAGSGRDRM